MSKNYYIYIVISHTATRFGKFLRIFGKFDYNHSAISMDEDLHNLYAFARPQYKDPISARLVKESYTSYTLNTDTPIPIKMYKLEVSKEAYEYVENTIQMIMNDKDFYYNLFSVFSYPFFQGCQVYKTYTCSEFVTHVLKDIGFTFEQPCCFYKPEDLEDLLKDYFYFEGDIRERLSSQDIDEKFFNKLTFSQKLKAIKTLYTITKRSFSYQRPIKIPF